LAEAACLARLVAERVGGAATLTEFIDKLRNHVSNRLPANADPQVRDVARRFALVAAAGELAAAWGILPWQPGEAEGRHFKEPSAVGVCIFATARRKSGSISDVHYLY
jgi:hypothetical protein